MNKELVIKAAGPEIVIAQLEDRKLTELNREKSNNSFSVGDIYLGRVRKVMPGLNAAFVDVGYEKDAFLHYLDLGPQVQSLIKFTTQGLAGKLESASLEHFTNEPDIRKDGKITQVLNSSMSVLVQIAKEPISTKGPRISSELSLAGRYLVLVPFSDKISVSQKIKDPEEKSRLKRLIQSIRPDVLVKGGDYKEEDIVGSLFVKKSGGSVKIVEQVPGISTSDIVAKIKK